MMRDGLPLGFPGIVNRGRGLPDRQGVTLMDRTNASADSSPPSQQTPSRGQERKPGNAERLAAQPPPAPAMPPLTREPSQPASQESQPDPQESQNVWDRPAWDARTRKLRLRGWLLKQFRKDGSAEMKLLAEFESRQWTKTPIAPPESLQGEGEESWECLKKTIENLNQRLNRRLRPHQRSIRLVALEEERKMTWMFTYGPRGKGKRKPRRH